MAVEQSLTYLTVSDFSAGIQQMLNSDTLRPFSPHPPGALAAVDVDGEIATYNCCALPEGGIGPLPFAFTKISTGPAVNPDDATRINSVYGVGGLHVPQMNQMLATAGAATAVASDFSAPMVSLDYTWDNGAGGPTYPRRFRMYRVETFFNNQIVEVTDNAGATPWFTSGLVDVYQQGFFGFTPMCDYRSNPAAPTTPGPPWVIAGICNPGALGVRTYQYSSGGFTNRLRNYLAILDCQHLISHQGRLVMNGYNTVFALGPNTILHNDDTFWTKPNDDALDNAGATSSFSQAVVGAYGAIASSNASELLVIRATSTGGLTVSSDMNDPVITDYSSIQGTNGCHIEGCWTPMGYVYGAFNGSIYAYGGGGRSVDLAPNMESGFWHENLVTDIGQSIDTGDKTYTGLSQFVPMLGKLAYHAGWIFVPGNWCYDVNANSWWRVETPPSIDDPVQVGRSFRYHYFATSPLGQIYASPGHWRRDAVTSINCLLAQADFNTSFQSNWHATTQLIAIAKEQEINEVRELVVEGMATGPGIVTIGITSFPNGNTFAKTFNFSTTDQPEIFRCPVGPDEVRGTHVALTLTASSNATTDPAPIIMRFDIGLASSVDVRPT